MVADGSYPDRSAVGGGPAGRTESLGSVDSRIFMYIGSTGEPKHSMLLHAGLVVHDADLLQGIK